MTKVQIAMWMSYFAFRILVGLLGFLLGLYFAKLIWGRYASRYRSASQERVELNREIDQLAAKNRRLSKEAGERNRIASQGAFDWKQFDFVDAKTADQFEKLGIHDVEHLASLNREQRDALTKKLSQNGVQWSWNTFDNRYPQILREASKAREVAGRSGSGLKSTTNKSSSALTGSSSSASSSATNDQGATIPFASSTGSGAGTGAGSTSTTGSSYSSNKSNSGIVAGGSGVSSGASGSTNKPGLTLPFSGGPVVDWANVKGVDPKVATELNRLGVKNFEQLESLKPEDRKNLEGIMAEKGATWNWGWLTNWKTAAAAATAIGGAAAISKKTSAPEVVKPEQMAAGFTPVNDPSKTRSGRDSKVETDVEAKKVFKAAGSGISKANESTTETGKPAIGKPATAGSSTPDSSKSKDDAEKKKQKDFRVAGFAGSSSDVGSNVSDKDAWSGESLEVHPAPKAYGFRSAAEIKNESANFSSKPTSVTSDNSNASYSSSTTGSNIGADAAAAVTGGAGALAMFMLPRGIGMPIDWGSFGNRDSKVSSELKALGFTHESQIASLSEFERRKLKAHFDSKGLKWNWDWLSGGGQESIDQIKDGQPKGSQPNDGQVKDGPEKGKEQRSADDKSGAGSGDSKTSQPRRVSATGTASLTGLSFTNPATPTGGGNAGIGNAGIGNAGVGSELKDHSSTGPKIGPGGLPILFEGVPEWKDDLTLLDGIDGPQSIELRQMGIYNFDQLHNLSLDHQARLNNWFRRRGWYLDMDQWRIASEGNTLNPSIEDIQQKAYDVYCFRSQHHLGGGQQTDWEQAEWELRGNPSHGYGVPHDVDDFAVTLTGISPEARDELYRMGLYNVHQVNLLNKDERRKLTRWFAGPRFGVDLTAAFGWLSSLLPAPQHLNFGSLFTGRPDHIDDLSRINGVGPATESDLNRIGVYQFSQISQWTDEIAEAIADTLELDNRIVCDQWIAQAKTFMNRG